MPRREAIYSIYALIDPRDNLIHYIGRTCDIKNRLRIHMLNTEGRNGEEKREWIADLKGQSLIPILNVIADGLTSSEAAKQERQYIQYYAELGMPLKNTRIVYRVEKMIPGTRLITDDANPPLTLQEISYCALVCTTIMETTPERETKEIDVQKSTTKVKEFLTPKDVSHLIKVSEYKIKKYINQGKLEGTMVGARWRIRQEAVDRYMAKNVVNKK